MDRALSRINGPDQDAIAFGREYVSSEAFRSLFRDGMNLIEEASVYLDGEGRQEARHLPRLEALSYANESMRLTTRLMQLASWLLLHRSLADGEISAEELNRQRAKIRMVPSDVSGAEETRDQKPVKMRELIQLSFRLQSRIMHLDSVMDQQPEKRSSAGRNAVALQQMLLSSAFESTKNS